MGVIRLPLVVPALVVPVFSAAEPPPAAAEAPRAAAASSRTVASLQIHKNGRRLGRESKNLAFINCSKHAFTNQVDALSILVNSAYKLRFPSDVPVDGGDAVVGVITRSRRRSFSGNTRRRQRAGACVPGRCNPHA